MELDCAHALQSLVCKSQIHNLARGARKPLQAQWESATKGEKQRSSSFVLVKSSKMAWRIRRATSTSPMRYSTVFCR